ncbi:MAG: PEP-CTERM sorting domain-containing protein [Acidobacteriota bacterium]|nr:PEP-CTERM sorting domain-containing protein [Acidobacteriota bacterium]
MPFPGSGFGTTTDAYMKCSVNNGNPALASASDSGTVSGYAFSNNASASAGPGFAKVDATNNGYQIVTFPGGASDAGWNDQMTIGNGTGQAVWIAPLVVDGNLTATGAGALARLGINAYQNYNTLQPYGSAINSFAYNEFLNLNGGNVDGGIRNSAIGFSWDSQAAFYGAVNYGSTDPSTVASYTVNRTLYFALPFTYGTLFEFGFYIGGVAGEGSAGAGYTANTASYDFAHTLTWGGPGYVIDQNGQINSDFTLTSSSGFNYGQAYGVTPEPATAPLIGLGLCAVAWCKRRAA